VDSCWLLADGSLALDGWCAVLPAPDAVLEVRVRGSREAWQPLVRKHRADVAAHLVGWADAPAGAADYGFIGRAVPAERLKDYVTLDFRSGSDAWSVEVSDFSRDCLMEDLFVGVAATDLTPDGLDPLVQMIANTCLPAHPGVVTAYRSGVVEGSPVINIVVPVFGQFDYLPNLLLALSSPGHPDVEVTVVCDDPLLAPQLVDWTSRWNEMVYRAPMRVLVHNRNAGFAAACNTGWAASTAPLQLLLNSDVLISDPRRDAARLASLLTDEVAASAPLLLFPDGRLQHAGMELAEPREFPGFVLPQHPGKGDDPGQLPTVPFSVPLLTGAAIMTRRCVLESVGGVPVVFGRGDFEDVLLCAALEEYGSLVVDPTVRWTHVEGASYDRGRSGGVPLTLAKSKVAMSRLAAW
jgi:GT2 family glycosyltransferase